MANSNGLEKMENLFKTCSIGKFIFYAGRMQQQNCNNLEELTESLFCCKITKIYLMSLKKVLEVETESEAFFAEKLSKKFKN